MKKQFGFLVCSALALGSVFFNACKKSEDPKRYAKINIINASPNNYDINFLVGKDTLNGSKPLRFFNSTSYVNILSGTQTISLYYAGVDSSFIDSSFNFREDKNYSLFVIDSPQNARPLLISDDLTTPNNGKAHLRFINLAPNSPEIDFVKLVDTFKTVIFPKNNFQDVSSFTEFEPGVYNFEIKLVGSDSTILKIPTIVLNNGRVYTIVARGIVGASGKTEYRSDVFLNKM